MYEVTFVGTSAPRCSCCDKPAGGSMSYWPKDLEYICENCDLPTAEEQARIEKLEALADAVEQLADLVRELTKGRADEPK